MTAGGVGSGERIRVASVGAGWVTRARHLPALRRSGAFEVVGIIDRHADRAEQTAASHRLPRWAVTDRLEAPWLAEVDAVTIGTPPAAHFPLARAALAAGKHVLMEKPVALMPSEGEELERLARQQRRVLAIVHNFQFARSAEMLRRKIAGGSFGRVTSVCALQFSNPQRRLPPWYESLPWGLFYDESPHLLYLIRSFAGEPTLLEASVVPSTTGGRTPAVVTARFDCRGVAASLYMNFEAPVSEWHLCIVGERRLAVLDVFRDILVEMPPDGGHLARDIMRTSACATISHWRGVVTSGLLLVRRRLLYGNEEVVRRFAAAVRGGAQPEGIDIADGLRVLRLQHAIMSVAGARDREGREA
jgi:predicted dehydrogenase